MRGMNVVIGCDHTGLEIKREIISGLPHIDFVDVGAKGRESVDYPKIAWEAAGLYLKGGFDFGILICGTGIGVSIAANKVRGIYAALVFNAFMAKMAKEHNQANFLVFASRIKYEEDFKTIVSAYADGRFSQEDRHVRRVGQVKELENGV